MHVISIEKILNYVQAANSVRGAWGPKSLYIATPPEKLYELAQELNAAGMVWCSDRPAGYTQATKYSKYPYCGMIIANSKSYYFAETQNPAEDPDIICINYDAIIEDYVLIDTSKLMSLMENI